MPLQNMACEIFLRRLLDLHLGLVDDDLAREMQIHLGSCQFCKERSDKKEYPIEHMG